MKGICSKCHVEKNVTRRKGRLICSSCHSKDTSRHEVCSVCRKRREVATRDKDKNPICASCRRRDPETWELCLHCDKSRPVATRGDGGAAICQSCFERQTPEKKRSYQKRWRETHLPSLRKSKRKYYGEVGERPENFGTRWTQREDSLILDPNRPSDRILAQGLRRTIRAIEDRRYFLSKGSFSSKKKGQKIAWWRQGFVKKTPATNSSRAISFFTFLCSWLFHQQLRIF